MSGKRLFWKFQSKNPAPVLLPSTTADFYMKETVVCAFNDIKEAELVVQRIGPDIEHWKAVLPKVTNFWRTCVLPEVLGRWNNWKHNTPKVDHPPNNDVCFCRTATDEDTVNCCNPECPISKFHLSCLQIINVPKTWYCPNCRTLPKFRQIRKSAQSARKTSTPSPALTMDAISLCKRKPNEGDKLVECHIPIASMANIFICHVSA